MLQQTKGIVLKSIKYGETSLIVNILTAHFGVQTYIVQGIRVAGAKRNRAGLLQPATLLDLVAYQKPQKSLQRLREYSHAYLYTSIQEEVVKNSIALFSVELLLRLLPEGAAMPELFDFAYDYFVALDKLPSSDVANFPLYFIVQCSRYLGYELQGNYSAETPHLNLHEGGFSENTPLVRPFVSDEDAATLGALMTVGDMKALKEISMNAEMRYRLLDWYIEFLHQHTQHLGQIRSLGVLRTVLH